ncbi:MAG: YybH family protein [Vicinamibacteria bacterium]
MKSTSAFLLLAFLSIAASAGQEENIEQEIRELVLQFNKDYEENNLEPYFAHYADDLTQWWPEGRVSLAQYKKQWQELIASGGRVEQNVVSDLQVQVGPSGDTAIASYRVDVVTRTPKGERTKESAMETDVWFKRDGKWQIVHLHYHPSPAGEN